MQNKTICLELDDFGFLVPGLDDLLRVKKHFPNFKITCFTIPMPLEFFYPENRKHFKVDKYKEWAKIINSYDWIEIGLHGFSHNLGEFDVKYQRAELQLIAAENLFKEIGLNYKKIFRAPFWQYSYDSLHALKDRGYTVCINPATPMALPEGLKTYKHNWSFEQKMPEVNLIKGHGHIYNTGRVKNAVGNCFVSLTKQIPSNAEFKFISELTDEQQKQ